MTMVRLRGLWNDRSGIAALEFALILPVLLVTFFGIVETATVLFIGTTIRSAVGQAARYGVTGAPGTTSREDQVRAIVADNTYGLLDMDKVKIETLVYSSFDNIGKPEPFTDKNGNGVYDLGEPFTDINGSGKWEPDMGKASLGGKNDIVLYRVSYAWGIMTPLLRQIMGESIEHVSSIAVRNEPFGS